jgi:hypothetical protein
MRVLMIMIMLVLVILRIRYFGLLLCSLIRLCHLSRGQIHAFQETSRSTASHALPGARGIRSFTTVRAFDREGQTSCRANPELGPSRLDIYIRSVPDELNENISS